MRSPLEVMTAQITQTANDLNEKAAAKAATGSASRVRRARILAQEPTLDRGEVTEKGSLNQRALRAGNAGEIDRLYRSDEGVIIA